MGTRTLMGDNSTTRQRLPNEPTPEAINPPKNGLPRPTNICQVSGDAYDQDWKKTGIYPHPDMRLRGGANLDCVMLIVMCAIPIIVFVFGLHKGWPYTDAEPIWS